MILTTHNHLGDHVILTAVAENVYDYCKEPVGITHSSYDLLFKDNPHVYLTDEPGIKAYYNGSQREGNKGTCIEAFTDSVAQQLGTHIQCTHKKGVLYVPLLSLPSLLVNKKYIVLQAGYQDNCTVKNISRVQWQYLIDSFPLITFVHCGVKNQHNIQPNLYNVIDMVNKTDILQYINIIKHSYLTISPVSACTHISGALDKNNITVVGNRLSVKLSQYPTVKHITKQCADGPCMAFYSYGNNKACKHPCIVMNEVIPSCMVCDLKNAVEEYIHSNI